MCTWAESERFITCDSLKSIKRFMAYQFGRELMSSWFLGNIIRLELLKETIAVSGGWKCKIVHNYADVSLCKNIKISYDDASTFNYFWDVWKKIDDEDRVGGLEREDIGIEGNAEKWRTSNIKWIMLVLSVCTSNSATGLLYASSICCICEISLALICCWYMLVGTGCFCHDCLESIAACICC